MLVFCAPSHHCKKIPLFSSLFLSISLSARNNSGPNKMISFTLDVREFSDNLPRKLKFHAPRYLYYIVL